MAVPWAHAGGGCSPKQATPLYLLTVGPGRFLSQRGGRRQLSVLCLSGGGKAAPTGEGGLEAGVLLWCYRAVLLHCPFWASFHQVPRVPGWHCVLTWSRSCYNNTESRNCSSPSQALLSVAHMGIHAHAHTCTHRGWRTDKQAWGPEEGGGLLRGGHTGQHLSSVTHVSHLWLELWAPQPWAHPAFCPCRGRLAAGAEPRLGASAFLGHRGWGQEPGR